MLHNLKVLHLTTANQTRGIADYSRDMIAALTHHGIQSEIYPVDQLDLASLSATELRKNLSDCCKKAQTADLVHIQHEFSFFSKHNLKHSINIFQQFLIEFNKIKKPIIVTFHTQPHFLDTSLLAGLKNFLHHFKAYQLKQQWQKKISSLFNKNNDFHAVVHTSQTRLKFINSGVNEDKIKIMPIGIPIRNHIASISQQEAKQTLNYPKNTILLSIFGFITENKGHEFAIKALELLPKHYHLAIIGGPHPEGKLSSIEKILALSRANSDFKERIRITGYVEPKTADLYHTATDICLAPYHGNMSGSGAIGWALSSGKPTIASRTTTFTEINDETQCLLLCEEKSFFELAQQIEYLIAHPDLQATLVKNALTYATNNQWLTVAQKLIMYYGKCLASHNSVVQQT